MATHQLIANHFKINNPETDLLGKGGMGSVYRAVDTQTGEFVAVKALHKEIVDHHPDIVKRFIREGEALRDLNHPNIVKMLATVEETGQYYLIIEYVEGGSLADLLQQQGRLPVDRTLEIALDLSDALIRAHRLNIIHRDLKPDNVLLAGDGTPRLTDFGIAHMGQQTTQLTQTGTIIGTVNYLSPESCLGEEIDLRADIWAYGVMLFEMLTGVAPFHGDTVASTLLAIVHNPPPNLVQLRPDIPLPLVNLIYRMLEKDKSQRIPSVRLIGSELEAILHNRARVATASPPTSVPTQTIASFQSPDSNMLGTSTTLEIPHPPEPTCIPRVHEFIGREDELAYFADKLATDHVALIVGMAGVGKTALAIALAEVWQVWKMSSPQNTAQSDIDLISQQVLSRQDVAEQHVFWHSFREDEGIMILIWDIAAFLAWHGQEGLWRMLQCAQLTGGQPPPPESLFDYVFQALQRHNYMLCLDDIHRVDDDPLVIQFMERLEDFIRAGDVALIATSRHIPPYLRLFTANPLQGLTMTDVGQLTVSRGLELSEAMIDALYTHTEGNAELLMLAINVLKQAENPADVMDCLAESSDIERYLIKEVDDNLSDDDRDVLIAVAVLLGYPGSRDAIETVSQRHRLKRLILELTDRCLLTPEMIQAEEYYNEHAIVRSFYYDLPSRSELKSMHRLAAEYYESEEPDLLRAVLHYARAGEFEQAAQLAGKDVWQVINQGQVWPLRRLLDKLTHQSLPPHAQVTIHLALGQICTFVGENEVAKENYKTALSLLIEMTAASTTVRKQMLRVSLGMGEVLRYESPSEALDWLERGLAELNKVDDPTLYCEQEAALRIRAGTMQSEMGHYRKALNQLERGLTLLPQEPSQGHVIAQLNLGNIHFFQGENQQAIDYWQAALAMSQEISDFYWMLVILSNLGVVRDLMGNWPEADTTYRKALALAEQLGSIKDKVRTQNALGMFYTKQGDYETAKDFLSQALQQARRQNLVVLLPYIQNTLSTLHLRMNDPDSAKTALSEAESLAQAADTTYPLVETYYLWAQVKLAKGALEEAQDYAEQALALARKLRLNREQGISLGVLGQVQLAGGNAETAQTTFEQSLALLEKQDIYEAARTQTVWGTYLVSDGNLEEGRQLLETAQATFAQLGAKQDLAEVEEILTT